VPVYLPPAAFIFTSEFIAGIAIAGIAGMLRCTETSTSVSA